MRSKASLGGGGAHGLEDGFSAIKRIGGACASFRMKLSSPERAHCLLLPTAPALPVLCAQDGFMY